MSFHISGSCHHAWINQIWLSNIQTLMIADSWWQWLCIIVLCKLYNHIDRWSANKGCRYYFTGDTLVPHLSCSGHGCVVYCAATWSQPIVDIWCLSSTIEMTMGWLWTQDKHCHINHVNIGTQMSIDTDRYQVRPETTWIYLLLRWIEHIKGDKIENVSNTKNW